MGYGHGLSLSSGSDGKPSKSEFTMGTHVVYKTRTGRRMAGQVVGPDQDYFPPPTFVFVSFPSTGFTHLLPVADLELTEGVSNGR